MLFTELWKAPPEMGMCRATKNLVGPHKKSPPHVASAITTMCDTWLLLLLLQQPWPVEPSHSTTWSWAGGSSPASILSPTSSSGQRSIEVPAWLPDQAKPLGAQGTTQRKEGKMDE